jgi:teichuronic acid biosynthesis glycosyltransferase TuaC
VAVSGALADKTEELSGRRPTVLPIGIDLKSYSQFPDKVSARRSLGIPNNKRIVLFVGSLSPNKGIRELLAALEVLHLENISGCIVGDGPMRDAVQRCPNATLAGVLPNSQVRLYLAAADAFVLPSHSEGMPTVLIEAAAAGLPILATPVGGIPELLDSERGLLIGHSSEAIVQGVRQVFEKPEEARERAARLRQLVFERYDVDVNAAALAALYRHLLTARAYGLPPQDWSFQAVPWTTAAAEPLIPDAIKSNGRIGLE